MVKAAVLCGHGINSERESKRALEMVGFKTDYVHLNELLSGEKKLKSYSFLYLPGGFSYGDDISAGKVLAVKLKHHLADQIEEFVENGKLILAVCNGFQAAVKLGILPAFTPFNQEVTLTFNDSGKFEDRWVYLKAPESKSIFTTGLGQIYLPVRHGEGKLVTKDEVVRKKLHSEKLVAFQYCDAAGELAGYPANPNGSVDNIAGISDTTGRVLGLMPHPECFLHRTNHPRWTRESLPDEGDGVKLMRNAYNYLKR